MSKEFTYQVDLKWKEGRIGEVSSPELDSVIETATPPEFPGGVPNIWSPEHFYAAAINSCFMTTFLAIAEKSKIEFTNFECKTTIKLELVDRKYLISTAEIHPEVTLSDFEKDKERIARVFEKTNEHCLVTNSMKTETTIHPTVK